MKKIIVLLSIVFTTNVQAQKKDTTKVQVDTVYVLSQQDLETIVQVLRANPISVKGQPMSFDAILNWIQHLMTKQIVLPRKEEPKK